MLTEIKNKINQGQSKRAVTREYGFHEETLRKRLKAGNVPQSLGRFTKYCIPICRENETQPPFNKTTKLAGKKWVKLFCKIAYQFAEKMKLSHRLTKATKLAGKKWVKLFCKGQGLAIRQPEKVSTARARGFNGVQVNRFFDNLNTCLEKSLFNATTIYNMDETGLLTVPNKIPKVVSTKGKKSVSKIVSAERGQLITAVCCVNAAGFYIPAALIYPNIFSSLLSQIRNSQHCLYCLPAIEFCRERESMASSSPQPAPSGTTNNEPFNTSPEA
ncbi:hypothetical protein QE152_g19212 [Popillia japonica]|uniref:Transposase n=1 Tax=Popillia japonica TaxID=7064 RepID=A0AAW1KVR1_POPJA